jgi:levoglucosan dehydrogenase
VAKEIRLALVGGGFIAGAHAAAWRVLSLFFPELPLLRRLVLCEVDEERGRQAASRLEFEQSEVSWENAVRRPDVDLVVIATPPDLHREIALAAIGAGKHVFCEKPLARSAGEADEMCRAAEKAGVVHVVGFNLRRAPALQQAAKMARDGSLGQVLHVSGRYFQDHGRDPSRPTSWRYDSARAGSGAVGDLGSHLLDLAGALSGEIQAIVAVARTVHSKRGSAEKAVPSDVDDCAAWLARFDSGATGAFEVSRLAAGRRNQLAIEVNAEKGSIAFDWERSNELQYFSPDDPADRQGFRTIRIGPANPGYVSAIPIAGLGVGFLETMVAQAADLMKTIAGLPVESPLPTFRDGWRNCRLMDAILESSARGSWVDVAKT